jgi:hypothetical protein
MEGQIFICDTTLRDGKDIWNTVGVSENIIEASWQALVDSFYLKLSKDHAQGHSANVR